MEYDELNPLLVYYPATNWDVLAQAAERRADSGWIQNRRYVGKAIEYSSLDFPDVAKSALETAVVEEAHKIVAFGARIAGQNEAADETVWNRDQLRENTRKAYGYGLVFVTCMNFLLDMDQADAIPAFKGADEIAKKFHAEAPNIRAIATEFQMEKADAFGDRIAEISNQFELPSGDAITLTMKSMEDVFFPTSSFEGDYRWPEYLYDTVKSTLDGIAPHKPQPGDKSEPPPKPQ